MECSLILLNLNCIVLFFLVADSSSIVDSTLIAAPSSTKMLTDSVTPKRILSRKVTNGTLAIKHISASIRTPGLSTMSRQLLRMCMIRKLLMT